MDAMVIEKKLGLTQYTLDQFFTKLVDKYGPLPSLAFVGQEPFSYAELGRRVDQLQQAMGQLGLKRGDKIIILGTGSPNWAVAFLAITTMGAIAVPVMDEFPEVDIEHIINHSEAAGIFITESLHRSLNLPSLDTLKLVFKLEDLSLMGGETDHTVLWQPLDEILAKKKPSRNRRAVGEADPIQEEDLAEILYTSGTTGHSKGVMLTHKNLVSNLIAGAETIEIVDENSVVLSVLPMAHVFGLTCIFLTPLYCGATIYFLEGKPSPKLLMRAMQTARPTILGAVPLIFEKIYHRQVLPAITKSRLLRWTSKVALGKKMLYKVIGKKVSAALGGRLECVVIGGASLNQEVEIFLRVAGIPYICGYGLSECSPLVTGCAIEEVKLGAVGKAVSDVSLKLIDIDPETGAGEIYVKGPNVMQGYYKNEEETAKVFTDDGWLITGDRGCLDEDGFLYIKGRSKNVIVGPSGENIYPEVIEDKLKESLFVEEALVYSLDNQLVARIYPDYPYIESQKRDKTEHVIAQDIEKILEQVRQEVNTQLPAFSRIQKVIEQRSPFVKTPTRKIKRAEYVPDYQRQPAYNPDGQTKQPAPS